MNSNGLSYIDLFAGAGGLSEGFIQSGYQPIAHVEMNMHASRTIETRIAYYYLKEEGNLESYYLYEKGIITREELFSDSSRGTKDSYQQRNVWKYDKKYF